MTQDPATSYSVSVSVDTTANPPVTVDPDTLDVSPGKATIKWQPKNGQEDEWTFAWVRKPDKTSELDEPPFSNTKVEDQEIEIEDDNEDPSQNVTYEYAIGVTKGGQSYDTDPRIINHN